MRTHYGRLIVLRVTITTSRMQKAKVQGHTMPELDLEESFSNPVGRVGS